MTTAETEARRDGSRNLDQLWRIYGVDEKIKASSALAYLPAADRKAILRMEDGANALGEPELALRRDFHELLHVAGLMEVGFQAGVLQDPENRLDRMVLPILEAPDLRAHAIDRLRLKLPGELQRRLRQPQVIVPGTRIEWYSALLTLDYRSRDREFGLFLKSIHDPAGWSGLAESAAIPFDRLLDAASSSARIVEAVSKDEDAKDLLDAALCGLEKFILFSSDLRQQTKNSTILPSLASAAFELYRPWYSPRNRILKITRTAMSSLGEGLQAAAVQPHLDDVSRLLAMAAAQERSLSDVRTAAPPRPKQAATTAGGPLWAPPAPPAQVPAGLAREVPTELMVMTADIAAAFVSNNTVSPQDVARVIQTIYQALAAVGADAAGHSQRAPLEPAVPVKRSITPDFLVCLEDGRKFKSLKRHLRTKYNMSPEEYREKWRLPKDYPMVAPNYAKARSDFARQMGLPRTAGRSTAKR